MISKILVLLGLFNCVFGLTTHNVTVDGLGIVIGTTETTEWTNRTIYSFRGIPYAQPPVGDLRFRPPVKVETWNGTLYATAFGNSCPQSSSIGLYALESYDEDCLTLNVYVPQAQSTVTALPVMIFIHGGTFMSGYASIYEPSHLLEEDVILVVPQFRLGPLGLLSLQTDEVPGNVQFLDQIMAMKWVQDNIGFFGGDKDKVTLFGQSSGGASVNLHLLSPLSKGLFHRTIMQSGSAFSTWVMDYDPVTTATNIANLLQCNTTNTSEIATCMKNQTVQNILEKFNLYLALKTLEGVSAMGGHRAVIQTAGEFKFLTEDPRTLVANAQYTQLPMMGGVTKQDGSYLLISLYDALLNPYGLINDADYLEHNLTAFSLKALGIDDSTGGVAHSMINTYFPNNELGDFTKMTPGLIDICNVFGFKASVYEMVYHNSRVQEDTYLYTFNYNGSVSLITVTEGAYPFDTGVGHSDDLAYLFPILRGFMSEKDIDVAKMMVQLWTSFATTGIPTADNFGTWPAMSTRAGPYLNIDASPTTKQNFLDEYTITIRESSINSLAFQSIPKPILMLSVALFMRMGQ